MPALAGSPDDKKRLFAACVARSLSFDDLARRARALDLRPEDLPSWPDWLERNERLVREGRTILDDPSTYGVHLDRVEGIRGSLRDTMSRMERLTREHRTRSHGRDRGPSRSM